MEHVVCHRLTVGSERFVTFDIESLADLPASVTRLVADVLERVIPLQHSSGRPWSEIRFELWIDTGRVIAFPAESPLRDRTDVGGCQICCAELAHMVADLDDANLPDADYDAQFSGLESRVASIVRDSIGTGFDAFSIRDPDDAVL